MRPEEVTGGPDGTPIYPRLSERGADIVIYSATKHIDGQGRALGGAILGPADYISGPVKNLMRHTGPAMSPFNAWIMLKGLETMRLRVERQHATALSIADFLAAHPKIALVRHAWRDDHPQRDLARRQMTGGGTIVTFEVDGDKAETFRVMNALEVIDISNNLGDAKSLVTHPATTTHRRLTSAERAAVGITDRTTRLSVGLEAARDLIEDLRLALG